MAYKKFSPGQNAPISGQYVELNTKGRKIEGEITMVKGKVFPPSIKKGYRYQLIDKTKHRSNR